MLCSLMISVGCSKDYLDKKPASNLNVPTTLADMLLLLDNTSDFRSPSLGQLSSDDVLLGDKEWLLQTKPYFANTYVWAADIFEGQGAIEDWKQPYGEILATNVVLQQLAKMERTSLNAVDYDDIKGMALFKRAYAFFDLVQVFAMPYNAQTASSDWGIPIRLTADINAPNVRATMKQTYDQILMDAQSAKGLIKTSYQRNYFNRPSKAAAYGFLSRVFLSLRDYEQAGKYADSALQIHDDLLDYNSLNTTSRVPFQLVNDEQLFLKYLSGNDPMIYIYSAQGYGIDTLLYNSYAESDLRKVVFFTKNGSTINKKGGYSGSASLENSIATDELFLTRAECYARLGREQEALLDLNTLLVKRYKKGTYVPIAGLTGRVLINKVLLERRKELVMRGLRWFDLRRLNMDGENITLSRKLNGLTYVLPPNDPRYALPIPPDVIQYSSMPQNNRLQSN